MCGGEAGCSSVPESPLLHGTEEGWYVLVVSSVEGSEGTNCQPHLEEGNRMAESTPRSRASRSLRGGLPFFEYELGLTPGALSIAPKPLEE